jgi:hypothetical protein
VSDACASPAGRRRRSTGPRTSAGKARSSKNAVKHGVHARLDDDEVALFLASLDDRSDELAPSARLAQALLSLDRARLAKEAELLALADDQVVRIADALRRLNTLDEYERKARSRLKREWRAVLASSLAKRT